MRTRNAYWLAFRLLASKAELFAGLLQQGLHALSAECVPAARQKQRLVSSLLLEGFERDGALRQVWDTILPR